MRHSRRYTYRQRRRRRHDGRDDEQHEVLLELHGCYNCSEALGATGLKLRADAGVESRSSEALLYICVHPNASPPPALWWCGQAWRVCVRLAAQVLGRGVVYTRRHSHREEDVGIQK